MKLSSVVWLAQAGPALGLLVGYGIWPYSPECAFACQQSLGSVMLGCSNMDSSTMTSPQCYASNTPWLTTLAFCIKTKCADFNLRTSQLQSFWEAQSTGDPSVQPKWGYTQTLENIPQPPTRKITPGTSVLNVTSLVPQATWQLQYNTLYSVQRENIVESGYSIAIIVTGFSTPLLLTWIRYFPFMSGILDRIRPYLVYPSVIGTYNVRPLPYLLGNAPTVGQSIYIAMFIILNVLLTAVDYKILLPHAWYANDWQEVMSFVFYRTGIYGFVLLPLTILFASRNNILLWLTNWSPSTYSLLHRWVARMFTLYALLHSILAVLLWKDYGTFESEQKKTYWVWGIVATLAATVLITMSGLYVRRFVYEFFLISHILLSVFVIVGCWYHIYYWEGVSLSWGYQTWIYCACAVWFFDRLVRVGRILKSGMRRSRVIDLGGSYVRVDIPGIRWDSEPGKHVFAYFPTLNSLRPWENHPFSVIPTGTLRQTDRIPDASDAPSTGHELQHKDLEKHDWSTAPPRTAVTTSNRSTSGLTLFIRKSTGMTKHLGGDARLLTLLDGPYPNSSPREVLCCDRILLIGGGIGITSLVPWIPAHPNVKLCWGIREGAKCLADEVAVLLDHASEKDIRIGRRLDVTQLLAEEVEAGWSRVGVVVCGPAGLCDDARASVVEAGRTGRTVFVLEVDVYSR